MNSSPNPEERQKRLAQHYHKALQSFLKASPECHFEKAAQLRREALPVGLEILDLARIHENALVSILPAKASSRTRKSLIRKAGSFFAETVFPMESSRQLTREINSHLKKFVISLDQRTIDAADSIAMLNVEILRRQEAGESLRTSERTSSELLAKSRQMQAELRDLSHQLLKAQEEERMKISRELHDVIAQTLTGINVQLDILKKQSSANNRQLHQKIRNTQLLVEKSVDIVHRFACELRPTVLDDLGLIPALKSFMKGFIADTGIQIRMSVSADIEREDNSIRTALYRVAQEALTNVARHAEASRVSLQILTRPGLIQMKITDNGVGFDANQILEGRMNRRLGLLGMRERIEMIGGTFSIQSALKQHTTICAEIPTVNPSSSRPATHTKIRSK
jgi:signal transduction histidine kinase